MRTNLKQFQFIACTNHPRMMEECRFYIDRLYVPEGYTVEIAEITDAKSMCEGYNRAIGMRPGEEARTEDVPYRIYLHQDVFIMNRYFLHRLLQIFASDERIGMLGMVGSTALDETAIMWAAERTGTLLLPTEDAYEEDGSDETPALTDAVCVDGFLIATAVDLPWREDVFDGFHFYDASQGMEFRKKGYRVVVPEQKTPWCVHDDGVLLNMWGYNDARKTFLKSYDRALFSV